MHIPHPAAGSVPATLALCAALPLWLVACHDRPRDLPANASTTGTMHQAMSNALHPLSARMDHMAGDAGPAATRTAELKGEAGARAVLRDWAGAVERGDRAALRTLGGRAQADSAALPPPGWRAVHARIGTAAVEGAAGSLYYRAPVDLDAVGPNGNRVHRRLYVTVRRVNDVEGASAESLRWHIERIENAS